MMLTQHLSHKSLSCPSSFIVFLLFISRYCPFLLSAVSISSSSSSSLYLPEHHLSSLLPSLSSVISSLCFYFNHCPLAITLCPLLSFSLPCFSMQSLLSSRCTSDLGYKKSLEAALCVCVFILSVCVLHLDSIAKTLQCSPA